MSPGARDVWKMLLTSRTIPTILNSLVISVVKYIDHESVYNVLYIQAIFFGELENALPTYTAAPPTNVEHEKFILKSLVERVCGWKILLKRKDFLHRHVDVCECAHSEELLARSCAVMEFARKQSLGCFTIKNLLSAEKQYRGKPRTLLSASGLFIFRESKNVYFLSCIDF